MIRPILKKGQKFGKIFVCFLENQRQEELLLRFSDIFSTKFYRLCTQLVLRSSSKIVKYLHTSDSLLRAQVYYVCKSASQPATSD